jgi:hypothetical protein
MCRDLKFLSAEKNGLKKKQTFYAIGSAIPAEVLIQHQRG